MLYLILIVCLLSVLLLGPSFYFFIKLKRSGVAISLKKCVIMQFQKTLKKNVVSSIIIAQSHSLPVTIDQIIQQELITGKPENVVNAMVLAAKKGFNLSFDELATADIAVRPLFDLIDKLDHKQEVCINQSFQNRKEVNFSVRIQVDYYYTFSALTFPETVKSNLVEELILSNVSNIIQLWTEPIDDELTTFLSQRIDRTFKDHFLIDRVSVTQLLVS